MQVNDLVVTGDARIIGNLYTNNTIEGLATEKYVDDAVAGKVDKVDGKSLSTNDYTTAEKNKLANIEDGANNFTYTLPNATSSTLGGVKIGSNISVNNGTISLSKSNVTSALGYTPPTTDTNTHYTTSISAGATGVAGHAKATNPFIKIADDNIFRNQIRLSGSGATTIQSDENGNITISSTTYSAATQSTAGLMSVADKKKLDGIANNANNYTYTLPHATSSTLGGVKIGDNISINNGTISLSKSNVTSALGYTPPTTNTTYSADNGISLSGTTFSNSGVRSISTGGSNGTISVNTGGTTADVPVKGLGSAAYTASTAYAPSSHFHTEIVNGTVGIKASDSNEISFKSNANYIYFGYDNRMGSSGIVDTYKFGTHSGASNSSKGIIECGKVIEDGTALADKYAAKSSIGNGSVTILENDAIKGTFHMNQSGDTEIKLTNTTYGIATQSLKGLMSADDKKKLDGIATNANNYTLPIASSSTLGGIKIGNGFSIDNDGVLKVNQETKYQIGIEYGSDIPTGTPESGEGSIYIRTGGDAVVEVGTSGIWTYRKWASGIAECWGKYTCFNVTATSAWGSMYESNRFTLADYPFAFTEIPTQNVSVIGTDGSAFFTYVYGNYGPTTTSAGSVIFYRPTPITNDENVVLSIKTVGRWK